jgi:DNA adenine methylase
MDPQRPILRYHGGKWLLGEWIISHFPEHRVYVEPFGGAASVLLQKRRSYAEVYNDMSGELCNLFRVVRDQGETLRQKLHLTPFSRDDYRESFKVSEDPVEQARRTVIRSMMGFGSNSFCRDIKSGFRSNSNRSGTTPAHDWTNYPECLPAIIERLRGVVIENRDGAEIMARHDRPDCLHYCDPPYVHDTRRYMDAHGNHGYDHEMTDEDHRTLAAFLRTLKGMVIVSGYDCPLYAEIYQGWRTERRKSLADGARKREETLWFSPNVPKHHDLFQETSDRTPEPAPAIRQGGLSL